MSNRHERRAQAARFKRVNITFEEYDKTPWICSWADCVETSLQPWKDGWGNLVLYLGEPQPDFTRINPWMQLRDSVLCPCHTKQLHEQLLRNLGPAGLRYSGEAA